MNVTTARPDDLNDLLQLVAEYQEEYENVDVQTDAVNEKYLKLIIEDQQLGQIFVGRTSSGVLVGFVTIYLHPSIRDAAKVPTIVDLFITSDYRQKGFGRQLFEHAARWAKTSNYKTLRWYVENLNLAGQYLFDPYEADSQGWVGYSMELKQFLVR